MIDETALEKRLQRIEKNLRNNSIDQEELCDRILLQGYQINDVRMNLMKEISTIRQMLFHSRCFWQRLRTKKYKNK